ncbi:glycosyltransferase family 4 protein [Tunturibacter empetritectus]|uniref:Glycosyltransferase involved in cell wall biosynthesis n=2 Tax=Tunturiibacter empetritectus TaxID=3069691 RepID=A0A7W8IHF3_9BACT|nr:glycosyltransferase family 1 protein [Edaphobacter lichenicola]MBB5317224.1 glycosyltransferase involved in cell wall biosynthesis [Edaphobacter lichenicola]
MSEKIRIGFVLPPGHWLGGKNYLRNLFAAIQAVPDHTITPVIFTGEHHEDLSDFHDIEVVTSSMFDHKTAARFARRVLIKTASQDIPLWRLLKKHHISVLSHSFQTGQSKTIKTVGWIPDLQHIHLPKFFTPEERTRRDRDFMSACEHCDAVVVSSKCAAGDLISFAPQYAHKVRLLRFVATPVPLANAASLEDLRQIYNFAEPFFLLPNQFWAHKNHRVVISALHQLKLQDKKFLVLATGSSSDYRNPAFFPSLMQYAEQCDVLDRFRVLGQIPFHHLAGLMQHATAFINPSLFEGWSTSVEEAKSMGKQVLLSDIPVHREQAPERGIFFSPENPDELAAAMIAANDGFDIHQDADMQTRAMARFPARQREFGEAYQTIVNKLVPSTK